MKKVEIHVFPDKTSSIKNYRLSLAGFIIAIVCVALAIIGFFIFSPNEIIENISNGNVSAVYKQNKIIRNEIKDIRESVDESILKAEETKILRDSTMTMGGLIYALEESSSDTVQSKLPRKSINEIEDTFKKLLSRLENDSVLAKSIPVIHPLKNTHVIKNRFKMIFDPFTEQQLPHRGIDYVAEVGDTVYATGAGFVSEVKSHRGFGLSIKIEHMPKIRTFYAHLGKALVKNGEKVYRGKPIAIIEKSGRESSIALHYEIRVDGVPVNPEDYFITK